MSHLLSFVKMLLVLIWVPTLVALVVACGSDEPESSLPRFTGEWGLEDDTDPFTDEGFISIWLSASEDDVRAQFDVALVVQCQDGNDLDVYVVWQRDLLGHRASWGAFHSLVVDWRTDSDDLQTHKWSVVESEATFHPLPLSAVEDLHKAERVSVRVYSHDTLIEAKRGEGSQATAVFHPAGFTDAYKPVENACGS